LEKRIWQPNSGQDDKAQITIPDYTTKGNTKEYNQKKKRKKKEKDDRTQPEGKTQRARPAMSV
jgi:hypothetical protein